MQTIIEVDKTLELTRLKIQRLEGYPVVMVTDCGERPLQDCLKTVRKTKDDTTQILRKSRTIPFNRSDSIKLVSVYSPESKSVVSLTLSDYGVFPFKEGETYTDYLEAHSSEGYVISVHPNHRFFMTLRMNQGQGTIALPEHYVFDLANYQQDHDAQKHSIKVLSPDSQRLIKFSTVPLAKGSPLFQDHLPFLVECSEDCSYSMIYKSTRETEYNLREGMLIPVVLSKEDPVALMTYTTGDKEESLSVIGKEANSLDLVSFVYFVGDSKDPSPVKFNGQFISVRLLPNSTFRIKMTLDSGLEGNHGYQLMITGQDFLTLSLNM
jgi:hypothetical protein